MARRNDKPLLERFLAKLDRDGGGFQTCWPWRGSITRGGYGQLSHGSAAVYAHRIAYLLWNGPIPDRQLVLHRCDNPPCCNPTHLFLGTHQDNADDCVAKGRSRGRSPVGERMWNSKLTEALVREIRASDEPQKALAQRVGVSQALVSLVRRYRIWRHVT